jgi:hypothetical protein
MSAEDNTPFQSSKPSEPPRGSAPGSSSYLGPGINLQAQGQSTGGKRFCSNCGKEWPAETKFCTACGTWMQSEETGKKSYKEHIAEQLQVRQETGELMPTFVQGGPPKKEEKGRSPLINVIIILLCAVLIVGAITYTFFKAEACVIVGKYMAWRGKYTAAADWYNNALKIKDSNWARANMTAISLKLYSEYLDKMKYKDRTSDASIIGGGAFNTAKFYVSADGNSRVELYDTPDSKKLPKIIIETDGKRYVSVPNIPMRRWDKTQAELNENEQKSRKKSDKEKVLSGLKDSAINLYISVKTEKVEDTKCYVITARLKPDKAADFIALTGVSPDYPGVSGVFGFKFYIGAEDKLLHRLGFLSQTSDEPVASYTFQDIKIGASISEGAFTVTPNPKYPLDK